MSGFFCLTRQMKIGMDVSFKLIMMKEQKKEEAGNFNLALDTHHSSAPTKFSNS
jgi:hypothetical protein